MSQFRHCRLGNACVVITRGGDHTPSRTSATLRRASSFRKAGKGSSKPPTAKARISVGEEASSKANDSKGACPS